MSAKFIKDYISNADWRVSENSNTTYSLQGLNNYLASSLTAEYWLTEIYPEHIGKAHRRGDIHIHDLCSLSTYCVGWSLEDLLSVGFTGVSGKTQSKPAKHFRTALGQIVNFFYTLQGESAGAQAMSNFDTLLAPFVRSDALTYPDIKQAMQEFIFNLNVPTRVGFQTPFTNLSFDLTVPSIYKESHGDYQAEMDLINKAFYEVMLEGDASGRVFTFPIPTYNLTKDFDWDNPAHDLLWKMAGKYGIPYFSNFINSDMNPEDARSMCCRLRLDKRELQRRGGGLFGANPLTGSIGVVTINLPRLGYKSSSRGSLLSSLDALVDMAIESLELKRAAIEKFTDDNLYPYSKFYLRDVKARTGGYWSNHFNTIGIIGLNEMLLNFGPISADITSKEGRAFGLEVMNHLREYILTKQIEKDSLINLEATPAEGTSFRLAESDKKLYKYIKSASSGDSAYYTNSSQLPMHLSLDMFDALESQDDFQTKYTGGTVFHLYLGEEVSDITTIKSLVKKIACRYKMPYFTLSPVFSICPNHGYISGTEALCPNCGAETEVYARVVGYYRPTRNWNKGKKAELVDRINFKI